MPTDLITTGILAIIRISLWILLLLFIAFSIIVFRQVQLMTKVLTVPISGGLKFVALGLLVFAVGIFLISLVIL